MKILRRTNNNYMVTTASKTYYLNNKNTEIEILDIAEGEEVYVKLRWAKNSFLNMLGWIVMFICSIEQYSSSFYFPVDNSDFFNPMTNFKIYPSKSSEITIYDEGGIDVVRSDDKTKVVNIIKDTSYKCVIVEFAILYLFLTCVLLAVAIAPKLLVTAIIGSVVLIPVVPLGFYTIKTVNKKHKNCILAWQTLYKDVIIK